MKTSPETNYDEGYGLPCAPQYALLARLQSPQPQFEDHRGGRAGLESSCVQMLPACLEGTLTVGRAYPRGGLHLVEKGTSNKTALALSLILFLSFSHAFACILHEMLWALTSPWGDRP